MDKNLSSAVNLQLERVKNALLKNNMNAYVVQTAAEACTLVESMLFDGATIASGGSMSLEQSDIMNLLRSGKYNYLDREKETDKTALYRKSFGADFYLCSSNAVTENGELYNVDGNSNRVAAICFGPDKVIMVVGRNKIVKNLEEAVNRVKRYAAPANCTRLSCDTPCLKTGICAGINGDMTSGCKTDGRICASYVVSAFQRTKGRINVILVNEELGY